MGQRLPALPHEWAAVVANGDDKRIGESARIRAQGTDAMTRGIQQGIAGITTGILRGKQTKREDARWEREFAARTDELQFRKDTAAAHTIKTQLDEMDAKEASMRPIVNPATGEMLTQGDTAGMERITKERESLTQQLDVVSKRMTASQKAQTVVRPAT